MNKSLNPAAAWPFPNKENKPKDLALAIPSVDELTKLKARIKHYEQLDAKLVDAKEKLKALELDAKRYQWLRMRPLDTIDQGGVFAGQVPQNIVLNGEDLDAAIDSAMAAMEKDK